MKYTIPWMEFHLLDITVDYDSNYHDGIFIFSLLKVEGLDMESSLFEIGWCVKRFYWDILWYKYIHYLFTKRKE